MSQGSQRMKTARAANLVPGTAILLWLVAGACGFGPQPDTSTFYVLSSLDEMQMPGELEPGETLGAPTPDLAIGIGPIVFPDYLARSALVTRLSDHQVDISNEEWWAEPFPESVQETLVENLSALLGTERFYEHPWHSSTALDYAIELSVSRFERDRLGVVRLMGRWMLKDGGTGRELLRRKMQLEEPAGSTGTTAAVAAQSRVLARLSREIAAAIRAADRRPPAES